VELPEVGLVVVEEDAEVVLDVALFDEVVVAAVAEVVVVAVPPEAPDDPPLA